MVDLRSRRRERNELGRQRALIDEISEAVGGGRSEDDSISSVAKREEEALDPGGANGGLVGEGDGAKSRPGLKKRGVVDRRESLEGADEEIHDPAGGLVIFESPLLHGGADQEATIAFGDQVGIGGPDHMPCQGRIAEFDGDHLAADGSDMGKEPGGKALNGAGPGSGGDQQLGEGVEVTLCGGDPFDSVFVQGDGGDRGILVKDPAGIAEGEFHGFEHPDRIDLVVVGTVEGIIDGGSQAGLKLVEFVDVEASDREVEAALKLVEMFELFGIIAIDGDEKSSEALEIKVDSGGGLQILDPPRVEAVAVLAEAKEFVLGEGDFGDGGEHSGGSGRGAAADEVFLKEVNFPAPTGELPGRAEAGDAGTDDGDSTRCHGA